MFSFFCEACVLRWDRFRSYFAQAKLIVSEVVTNSTPGVPHQSGRAAVGRNDALGESHLVGQRGHRILHCDYGVAHLSQKRNHL